MKSIKYLSIALISLLAFSSCKDWLDISPSNQIKAKDMFKKEAGFRDALFGVYTSMASADAYGGNETFRTLELIAQVYSQVGSTYTPLYRLDYSANPNVDTKAGYIDPMWAKNYYAIANCNDILAHVDNDKSIFSEGVYEMVKAEAMALRAFLHFDMLRAYGPIPTAANMDKPAIPVVKQLTSVAVEQSSTNEVVDFVLKELEAARKIIAPVDPLGPYYDEYTDEPYYQNAPVDHYEYVADDGFKIYRRSRFNYYGITAAMARVALWGGKTADAMKYALEVIDSGKFPMTTETQGAGQSSSFRYYVTTNEFITSVYYNRPDEYIYKIYFNTENTENNIYRTLNFKDADITDLFGADRDFDWRYKHMISLNFFGNHCSTKYSSGTRIPLLKISEMYLICAEVSGDVKYLNQLRDHRGFINQQLPGTTDMDQAITTEYRREFIAEGQLFYYYKRKNFDKFPNGRTAGKNVFVLPLPDKEIEYGYIKKEE